MPTRRITRSPVKVTGTVPDGQKFESSLEEDFFVLLRFNRFVESFEDQPVTIEWQDDKGKFRKYTPDVLVHYRTDLPEAADQLPVLCEVKPDAPDIENSSSERKVAEAENDLKWAAAERFASSQGWAFKVYRESEIRTPYLDNARFLLRYLERGKAMLANEVHLLEVLAKRDAMTLGDWTATLSSSMTQRAKILPSCYRLISISKVDVDLSVKLSLDSLIRPVPNA